MIRRLGEAVQTAQPPTKGHFRMVSIIALAGVIVAMGFMIELVLFVRLDILSAFIAVPSLKFVVYAVIGSPLVEETIKIAVLSLAEGRLLNKRSCVTVRTAVLMGIFIGCLEFVTKTFGLSSKRPHPCTDACNREPLTEVARRIRH